MLKPDVIVVGAGAAGLFASLAAARTGASVLVLEKTRRIGTKILISGGGKCNIAHAGPLEDVIRAFDKAEAVFVRPSCYGMPNGRIMELFTENGLELYERPDGRVFPTEGTAKDVVEILLRVALDLGVNFCLHTQVTGLEVKEGVVQGVEVKVDAQPAKRGESTGSGFGAKALLERVLRQETSDGKAWTGPDLIHCSHVIIACGGSSYPNCGTTGDGWKWAQALGHSVIKPRAALAPVYLEPPLTHLSGLAVQNCRLVARGASKKIAEAFGDLLFTHHGISGPATLKISRQAALALESGPVWLELDLVPSLSIDSLADRLNQVGQKHPSQTVIQWLQTLAPHRLGDQIALNLPNARQTASTLGRKSRIKLAEIVKGWPLGEVRSVPLEKGEVTAGGISLEEVDPKTMRSHLIKGLYLAGEVLDVAGPVGGYNLQAAFATGYRAGETAAQDALANSH